MEEPGLEPELRYGKLCPRQGLTHCAPELTLAVTVTVTVTGFDSFLWPGEKMLYFLDPHSVCGDETAGDLNSLQESGEQG